MPENVAQLMLNTGQLLRGGDKKGIANGSGNRFREMVNVENPSEMRVRACNLTVPVRVSARVLNFLRILAQNLPLLLLK